jgi:hypothetical protein
LRELAGVGARVAGAVPPYGGTERIASTEDSDRQRETLAGTPKKGLKIKKMKIKGNPNTLKPLSMLTKIIFATATSR